MATNWKSTLWDIILTILTLGISHIQKRKKNWRKRRAKNPQNGPPKTDHLPLLCVYAALTSRLFFISRFANVLQSVKT